MPAVDNIWIPIYTTTDDSAESTTSAMQVGDSIVLRVTTKIRNLDSTYSLSEALTTIPNSQLKQTSNEDSVKIVSK